MTPTSPHCCERCASSSALPKRRRAASDFLLRSSSYARAITICASLDLVRMRVLLKTGVTFAIKHGGGRGAGSCTFSEAALIGTGTFSGISRSRARASLRCKGGTQRSLPLRQRAQVQEMSLRAFRERAALALDPRRYATKPLNTCPAFRYLSLPAPCPAHSEITSHLPAFSAASFSLAVSHACTGYGGNNASFPFILSTNSL